MEIIQNELKSYSLPGPGKSEQVWANSSPVFSRLKNNLVIFS